MIRMTRIFPPLVALVLASLLTLPAAIHAGAPGAQAAVIAERA